MNPKFYRYGGVKSYTLQDYNYLHNTLKVRYKGSGFTTTIYLDDYTSIYRS